MRFAWERNKISNKNVEKKYSMLHPLNLIFIIYNVIWWFPIILSFFDIISYKTGFILFSIVTIIRIIANILRNNLLTFDQGEKFPLRSP